MKDVFGRTKCYIACGLLLLLITNNVVSVEDKAHQSGPIDEINENLKGSMKERALSLSSTYFIRNMGQMDSDDIQFYSRDGNVFFTEDGVLIRFSEIEPIDDVSDPDPFNKHMERSPGEYHEWGVVLKYSFIGSNSVYPEGRDRCTWNTNYFRGSDPAKWYTDVPNYREIVYQELWDGIDLVYRLKDGSIKYDLIVHPGADPSDIRFRIDGANDLRIDPQGDLVIGTEYWDLLDSGLVSYYQDGSHEPIPCRFELMNDREYKIGLGEYDRSRNVVIDPLIDYSTFIGGSMRDRGYNIAIDPGGNAYIIGYTEDGTIDYPTTSGAFNTTYNGGGDVFVTKLNPTGSSLVYSTFIGGSGVDFGYGIAIDSNRNAYITGSTEDGTIDYPTTSGAFDTIYNGGDDVFVTKLNRTGSSLVYSTFIGGSGSDLGRDIAIDTEGNAYITGETGYGTIDYPTTSGAYDTTYNNGSNDVFVTKVNSAGSSLVYSTFIGGSDQDYGMDIAIDSSGNAYITGCTIYGYASDYPTTSGAYDTTHNGESDVFVTKLDSTGSFLVYSTFIGGSGSDIGYGIAIDTSGNAYITGCTGNGTIDYPTTSGAYDTTHNGGDDVFVTKVNSAGSSLVYSTFIGGSGYDIGYGIAIDTLGNAYISGYTIDDTTDYPTTSRAFNTTHNGGRGDVFVTKLGPSGSSLVYSTFIGGSGDDHGYGIAIDIKGNAIITGWTETGYPTTSGAFDTTYNGGFSDVFVTKLTTEDVSPPEFGSDHSTLPATTGDQFTFSIDVRDNVEVSLVFVEFWFGYGTPTNVSMMGAGPYEYNITVPSYSTEPLSYIFHAEDTANNWDQKTKRVVEVLDNDKPIFGTDSTPTTGTTGDQFTFSIEVTDNIGVSGVFVEYWFGYGSNNSTNQSMLGFWPYKYTIYIPTDSTEPLNYILHAEDTADNWDQKTKRVVEVLDNDGPVFGYDTTPTTGTTGDRFTFSIEVTDNIGVSGVFIEYWYGNDSDASTNHSMLGFGIYKYTIYIRKDSTEPLNYIFHAKDTANNWDQNTKRVVDVLDNDGPVFGYDPTPDTVEIGDQLKFSINVTDNIAVSTVWIEYWFGDGAHKNDTMTGNGVYTYLLTIPINSTDIMHYIIHANDTSDNWNEFAGSDISILDNNPPYFGAFSIPATIGTGEILNCNIQIFDDVGVYAVYFEYWSGIRPHHNVTMSGTISYSIDLDIPKNSTDPLNFILSAVDNSGNWISMSDDIIVMDTIDPISRPGPGIANDEDSPTILDGSLSSDNIGIVNWTWILSNSDVDVILYGIEKSYIFYQPGKYRIFLNVSDAAGNWQVTSFNIKINDITDPIIVISSMDFDENEVATFDGSRCTDNVGIVNWTWTFDDGGGSKTLYGENASCIFSKQGKYTIDLTVRDEAGNSATDTMIVNIHEADGLGKFIRDHWWILPILLAVSILILIIFLVKRGKVITGSSEPIPAETTKASPPISTEE